MHTLAKKVLIGSVLVFSLVATTHYLLLNGASVSDGGSCYSITAVAYSVPELAEFLKPAEEGDATAETDMGNYYRRDDMFPHYSHGKPDYSAAAKWYRKAADQGNPYAQFQLAYQYLHGYGV